MTFDFRLWTNDFRLNAFTLIELVLVMILGGIVAATAVAGYGIVERQLKTYREMTDGVLKLQGLYTALSRDMELCAVLRNDNGRLIFEYADAPVIYEQYENGLLRTAGGLTDSFRIDIGRIETKFTGEPQTTNLKPQTSNPQPATLSDELLVVFFLHDKEQTMRFRKVYGADVLMELEERRPR